MKGWIFMKKHRNFSHPYCLLTLVLSGAALAGCLARFTVFADSQESITATALQEQDADSQEMAGPSMTACACESDDTQSSDEWENRFQIYKPFGLTYNAGENKLYYYGRLVRCFEDYYPLDNTGNEAAGIGFYQEDGVTDVCAVRDFTDIARHADGSYDPSGKLTGLRESSGQGFAVRDTGTFKNPPSSEATATSEEPVSEEEMMELAQEYVPFGVTYDSKRDQWFFHGEKVRRFNDILLSNGEAPGSGHFSGSLRSSFQENGTVDICTERDFTKLNADGYGTLTGIRKCS